MRPACGAFVLLLACSSGCLAWHTTPHRRITKAALDTLPAAHLARLGPEASNLIEIYCLLPDLYVEMETYGFVRKGPGPQSPAEILIYCVRPDGVHVHSACWDREQDLASLVYVFERIVYSLGRNRPGDTARYSGILAHLIQDSLSPPHAVSARKFGRMVPAPAAAGKVDIHAALESSVPAFDLGGRTPMAAGSGILDSAESILERCYAAAAGNRRDLPVMIRAVYRNDRAALDAFRLRAGKAAAEILADALYTLLALENRK